MRATRSAAGAAADSRKSAAREGRGQLQFPPLDPGLPDDANFYLYPSGNSIYRRYETIPEPAGFDLLALALGLMTVWIRPRRRLVVT